MSQEGWTGCSYDAKSAYLQTEGIDHILLIGMPERYSTDPGKEFYAQASIYGTKDGVQAWYKRFRTYLAKKRIHWSRLERG
eukprot:5151664-Pyramimonas_sp.AAC.1